MSCVGARARSRVRVACVVCTRVAFNLRILSRNVRQLKTHTHTHNLNSNYTSLSWPLIISYHAVCGAGFVFRCGKMCARDRRTWRRRMCRTRMCVWVWSAYPSVCVCPSPANSANTRRKYDRAQIYTEFADARAHFVLDRMRLRNDDDDNCTHVRS